MVERTRLYDGAVNMKRIAAATAITAGLGLAGVGTASLAEAQPAALFGGHFADQSASAIVNAGCAWY